MPEYGEVVVEQDEEWFYLRSMLKFKYPFDPNNPVYFLAAPPGGPAHANYPFIVKGDDGLPPTLQTAAEVTEIAWDDATPVTSSWVIVTPAGPGTGPVYKEVKKVRKGKPGTDGTSVLNPASFGTPAYRRLLQVNSGANGFEYTPQKVGGMHWPSAITEAPAASATSQQIAVVNIAANTYPYPVRLEVSGVAVSSGTTTDMQIDFVARLTNAGGVLLGKCPGIPGAIDRLVLASGPDAGAAGTLIAANAAATVVFRTEKVAGTGTYATGVIDASRCCVTAIAQL